MDKLNHCVLSCCLIKGESPQMQRLWSGLKEPHQAKQHEQQTIAKGLTGSSISPARQREWPDPKPGCETCQDESTKESVPQTPGKPKVQLPAAVGVIVGCREEMTWVDL